MGDAWIDGRSVALDEAIGKAAELLSRSRFPVVAGLGADVAGVRRAVALAERLGGAVDHMHSHALFSRLEVLRQTGVMATTPNEARVRGDLILAVGQGIEEGWPQLAEGLPASLPAADAGAGDGMPRRVIRLCPGRAAIRRTGRQAGETVGRDPADLPRVLAALRARVAGRSAGRSPVASRTLDTLAATLKEARFGVAAWSAALDTLTVEMLCGLVKDLNATTRFTGLPVAPRGNAEGALQVCGWMTGFPMRIGFGRDRLEHDAWRFDADRLVESGEADCALWISAYDGAAPAWRRKVPMIALAGRAARFRHQPSVLIEVGRPGIDHDAVEHSAATGTLTSVAASRESGRIPVAEAIDRIAAALPGCGSWPC